MPDVENVMPLLLASVSDVLPTLKTVPVLLCSRRIVLLLKVFTRLEFPVNRV